MKFHLIKNKVSALYEALFRRKFSSSIEYWEHRAKQYGKRSVINIGHPEEQIDFLTNKQKENIFPYLEKHLSGKEKTILDFGCGPGRFTADLAAMVNGQAVGVDPIQSLLDLAIPSRNVEYRRIKNGIIPAASESFDVVWVCLVLGGIIHDDELVNVGNEIKRVLKTKGLLILIENTAQQKDGEFWKFRSLEEYQQVFEFLKLAHESDYYDLEERISIMTGRKYV